jgi:uncharacterized 2Fe-2S/4Fe-4S cluster protein (DUF4445 family)
MVSPGVVTADRAVDAENIARQVCVAEADVALLMTAAAAIRAGFQLEIEELGIDISATYAARIPGLITAWQDLAG